MKLHQLIAILEAAKAAANASPIFFCGGLVRDRLLGSLDKIEDIDITTGDKTVHNLARETAIELGKQFSIKMSHLDDGHTSIKVGNTKIDFSSNFEMPNIERALQKEKGITNPTDLQKEMFSRDFTVNALLLKSDLKTVRDPTGQGLQDIKAKILRTCLSPDETLRSDINRIPRVIYLAAKLDFNVDKDILSWLKQNASLVQNCKPGYLAKMISKGMSFNKDRVGELLDETGLRKFIPKQNDLNGAVDFFRRNFDYC